MASLEALLFARLTGAPAVAAAVQTRVYPGDAPQGAALPHLVYSRAGGGRVRAMGSDTGVEPVRVQIACKAIGFDAVLALAEAVKAALKDWRDAGATPAILDCAFESEFDGFDDRRTPEGGGPGSFRRNVDFLITYRS